MVDLGNIWSVLEKRKDWIWEQPPNHILSPTFNSFFCCYSVEHGHYDMLSASAQEQPGVFCILEMHVCYRGMMITQGKLLILNGTSSFWSVELYLDESNLCHWMWYCADFCWAAEHIFFSGQKANQWISTNGTTVRLARVKPQAIMCLPQMGALTWLI